MAESDEVDGDDGGDCKNGMIKRSPYFKNLNRATGYLTPNARRVFTQLKQLFTEALIFQHFNQKYYIRIEIDASGYAIGGMLSQFTNSSQWHPLTYYFQKMILNKTRYKTHDDKFLAIVEAFKT